MDFNGQTQEISRVSGLTLTSMQAEGQVSESVFEELVRAFARNQNVSFEVDQIRMFKSAETFQLYKKVLKSHMTNDIFKKRIALKDTEELISVPFGHSQSLLDEIYCK